MNVFVSHERIGWSAIVLLLVTGLAAGCGGPHAGGPVRYAVSGRVTYEGEPVPMGFIEFLPDTSQDNSGPGGGAPIRNGAYEADASRGVVGGPYIVRIRGTDGVPTTEEGEELSEGQELFPLFETHYEFPQQDATVHFEVSDDVSEDVSDEAPE